MVDGSATLQGLTLIDARPTGTALSVVGGNVLAELCDIVGTGDAAAYIAKGGQAALRGCQVRGAGVVFSGAGGSVEDTRVLQARGNSIEIDRGHLAVRRCLIDGGEAGGLTGVITAASDVHVEHTEITRVHSGLSLQQRAGMTARGCSLWSVETGAFVDDSALTLEDCQVSGTSGRPVTAEGAAARLTAVRTHLEDAAHCVELSGGAQARFEDGTLVRVGQRNEALGCGFWVYAAALELRRTQIKEARVDGVRAMPSTGLPPATALLEDCRIQGARANGVYVFGGEVQATLLRTRIDGAGQHGVNLAIGAAMLVEDCDVESPAECGAVAEGTSIKGPSRLTLRSTRITNAGAAGMMARGAELAAEACTVNGAGSDGAQSFGGGGLVVTGSRFEGVARYGVCAAGDGRATFTDCHVQGAGEVGVIMETSAGTSFTGGSVRDCTTGAAHGVYAGAAAGRLELAAVTVTGNTVGTAAACDGGGLRLRDCQVEGNTQADITTPDQANVTLEGTPVTDR